MTLPKYLSYWLLFKLMRELGLCSNYLEVINTGLCKEAEVTVICQGFKDVCPFPDLYKEVMPKPRAEGMMTSEARKIRREKQLELPGFHPALNTFKAPYSV